MRIVLICGFLVATTSAAFAGMGVGFQWGPTKQCFDPNSPPISVRGVPAATRTLRFKLTDLNAVTFKHGGGDVAFGGQTALPYGAFHYKGPCPPDRTKPHTYRLTMQALDANGAVLATAKAQRRFP